MANPLILFPTRAAIGQVDASGRVMQSPEFARALADLLMRVGGPTGASITDLMKELERRPSTLAQSSSSLSVSGTTSPTVLVSVKVPGNSMGPNGMVRITTTWSVTNNENNKTIIMRFGGSDISNNPVTTVTTYQEQQILYNRSAPDAQIFMFGGFGHTGEAIAKLAKDTRKDQNIDIVAQLSDSADVMTLEAFTVELIPTI